MPARAKRPCRHKGCAAITNDVSGYCDQHRKQHAGDGWRNYQSGKSRKERGYQSEFNCLIRQEEGCIVPIADVVKLIQYGFTKNIRYILS